MGNQKSQDAIWAGIVALNHMFYDYRIINPHGETLRDFSAFNEYEASVLTKTG